MLDRIACAYLSAKSFVIDAGYHSEIDWQESIQFENVGESDFLREAAWVILSCGMKESIVRQKFPMISKAFFDWESAKKIVENIKRCLKVALRHFGHRKKIEAIIRVSAHVHINGFDDVCRSIEKDGIEYIMKFPYMGPATSYHFAKNLGLPVSKPDRHLSRIAKAVGYNSPQLMCSDISQLTGEKVSVIDLIFWRFATLQKNYQSFFYDSIK
ncbi:MAG: hypothetical protein FVQ85_02870 [Planctomycetes bacterium]|nr:hypothetical protein [Planctomycetota bacterium]